ncbi:uncharacterized protein LOC105700583 [Orussus abietinus]|uniref:uncharacterized protein LOC105700583 n=1 Tax=Orussus abietinus TaxID=222816 RepID=UPI000625DF2B|nr:uncharacterized protein LOC105700583 [Orussus abietinus]
MFDDHTLEEKVDLTQCKKELSFYDVEGDRNLIDKRSPQEEMKYFTLGQYSSPLVLNKSMPRRNRSLVFHQTNRSLNFDGHLLKSPHSMFSCSSPIGDKNLSRSAKIMRALNLDEASPCGLARKENKLSTLDSSPAKSLSSFGSPCYTENNRPNQCDKFDKILNFNISYGESNVDSLSGSSLNSFDENQNQTPLRRNERTIRILNHLNSNENVSTKHDKPIPDNHGGGNQFGVIPNVQSIRKGEKMSKIEVNVTKRTPRNLFDDFNEDENERPRTPENVGQPVPENLSAIKKSHKKERSSRRLEKFDERECVMRSNEKRRFTENEATKWFLTPPMNKPSPSPCYSMDSIKKSPKQNKIKKKSFSRNIDDSSDTSSIFDLQDETKSNLTNGKETPEKSKRETKLERSIDLSADDFEPGHERSLTPEHVNSSRLLLPRYSSVKKSHRKNKHRKILSGFIRRQSLRNREKEWDGELVRDTALPTVEVLAHPATSSSGDEAAQKRRNVSAYRLSDSVERPVAVEGTNDRDVPETSTPLKKRRSVSPRDPSGRTTPETRTVTELTSNVESIKRSHKKGKRKTREDRKASTAFTGEDGNAPPTEPRGIDCNDPKSRSVRENDESGSTCLGGGAATPPNRLETKSYLKSLQSVSIKGSHKKERESRSRKPFRDRLGQRIPGPEEERTKGHALITDGTDCNIRFVCDEDAESLVERFEKELPEASGSVDLNNDLSDDGSIFDLVEKLNDQKGEYRE